MVKFWTTPGKRGRRARGNAITWRGRGALLPRRTFNQDTIRNNIVACHFFYKRRSCAYLAESWLQPPSLPRPAIMTWGKLDTRTPETYFESHIPLPVSAQNLCQICQTKNCVAKRNCCSLNTCACLRRHHPGERYSAWGKPQTLANHRGTMFWR